MRGLPIGTRLAGVPNRIEFQAVDIRLGTLIANQGITLQTCRAETILIPGAVDIDPHRRQQTPSLLVDIAGHTAEASPRIQIICRTKNVSQGTTSVLDIVPTDTLHAGDAHNCIAVCDVDIGSHDAGIAGHGISLVACSACSS